MSSINTNPSAMTALQSLKVTNKALENTQNAISTGYRVATARDNAAYWSIATTMRSDNKALSTVQDALGLGAATVDVMYTAVNDSIKAVDEIKAKLVAAREPGLDWTKIQSEITELQRQLRGNAEAASFSGENWLAVDSSLPDYSATKEVVSSFSRSGSGVAVSTITLDMADVKLYDDNDQSGILDTETTTTGAGAVTVSVSTLDITAANLDYDDLDELISFVDQALLQMTSTATILGSAQARIELQQSFVSNLMDAV